MVGSKKVKGKTIKIIKPKKQVNLSYSDNSQEAEEEQESSTPPESSLTDPSHDQSHSLPLHSGLQSAASPSKNDDSSSEYNEEDSISWTDSEIKMVNHFEKGDSSTIEFLCN
jgi:hypothetical protein